MVVIETEQKRYPNNKGTSSKFTNSKCTKNQHLIMTNSYWQLFIFMCIYVNPTLILATIHDLVDDFLILVKGEHKSIGFKDLFNNLEADILLSTSSLL